MTKRNPERLSPGARLLVTIVAVLVSLVGCGGSSTEQSEQLPEGPVTMQHSIALEWNASSSTVDGYYIYRGLQTGGPYSRISALETGTTYTDSAVESGEEYFYVVTAVAESVESSYSNEASGVIPGN